DQGWSDPQVPGCPKSPNASCHNGIPARGTIRLSRGDLTRRLRVGATKNGFEPRQTPAPVALLKPCEALHGINRDPLVVCGRTPGRRIACVIVMRLKVRPCPPVMGSNQVKDEVLHLAIEFTDLRARG